MTIMNATHLHIRPYRTPDAEHIITWYQDEQTYYKWSAGILGPYPLTADRLNEKLSGRLDNPGYFPFTAFDETGPKGFFILRRPEDEPVPEHVTLPQPTVLRFGFVIVSPECRGKGYGKQMLQLGAVFARECYGAENLSLGVFTNNPAALHCYEATGFHQTGWKSTEPVMPGDPEPWTVMELLWGKQPYIIETPRLLLRRYRPTDFDSLYPILSDAETMVHYPAPFTEEQVHQWIIRNIKRYKNDGFGLWAVLLKNPDGTEGRFIGDCGLTIQNIDGEQLPEVGYHIARDLWHQGYGKEAARAVRDWAFTNTTYDELWSWMKYTNEASQATARANGMTKIKEYADDVNGTSCAWRITRSEWNAL